MRVFVAGASGVMGLRLVPLLVADGHEVLAMTRSSDKQQRIEALGATPVVCDVFHLDALTKAMVAFGPTAVVHQLTDLPDNESDLPGFMAATARIRREGTRNLISAARSAGASLVIAQSVAWRTGDAITFLEQAVLEVDGIVLRYGQWYGPGTYFEREKPPPLCIHIDAAALRTVAALSDRPGIYVVADDS